MARRFILILALALPQPEPSGAALLGNNFELSGPGCRFPDVAFGSADSRYLVVWPDYSAGRVLGRFVTHTGTVSAAAFPISEAPYGALYPAVAYDETSHEFLVTWDDAGDRGGVIYGQRVRASDGALVGANFPIGSIYGGIRSAVAWSSVSGCYLVVYWGPGGAAPEVYGQRVAGDGALLGANFNISNDGVFSGYPAVAWGVSDNQFLVTWDNDDGNIHGRRVDPGSGALLGSMIVVTTGGAKDRSCSAYDSVNQRWLVQFNDGANAGMSYDQSGQLINADGTLNGGLIPLAHTPAFEGDTQFGGDVAFVPGARRFFSSFGTDNGMGGQESSATGALVGPQVVLGTGYYTSLNNAADPEHNRFLTVWEGLVSGSFRVFGQLCAATLEPVTDFTATSQDTQNALAWRNPPDGHFTGTMIRMRTDRYPASPDDGVLVVDRAGVPGASDSFLHTNLVNWATCYYSAFAHDVGPNYALAAQAAATPRPPVTIISTSDFNSGTDGWTLATWQAGALAPGTIVRDAASGTMVSTGSGVSNNRDACTREGSLMTRAISTLGQESIQVEYDVMAALHAPPTGSPAGSCVVLEGSLEDKFVVSFSTSGTNGPWSVAQVLSEGMDLPTDWTRKLVNLAGISAVDNNPDFALRFQWQFNSGSDTGAVDNIRVLSGAVMAPAPVIGLSRTNLDRAVQAGQGLPSDVVRVSNTGEGVLHFTVSDTVSWLSVSPATDTSFGPPRSVVIAYDTAGLPVGDYETTIQVASTNAINSPQSIAVKLRVIPVACFWEPFDYYAGDLALMGGANWSGSATNQLVVDGGRLRIVGGAGAVSASHTVNCAGSNGLIAAHLKIKRGSGSGDIFWNIAFDDPAGNNLARWYGGSTMARGRIGSTVTADLMLSGPDTWDDLYLKLDTAANTAEFFFNGTSVGVLSHGSTPSNTVGSIRLERLDRLSATGDTISFDDLTLGAVDATPPRLGIGRSGDALLLWWPPAGMEPQLLTATNLVSAPWIPITDATVLTNGYRTYTTRATNVSGFFRLRRQ